MTGAHNSILRVLLHASRLTSARLALGDFLAACYIQILEKSQFGGRAKKIVVRQVLKNSWFDNISHLMQFNALRVVDIEVLFLSNSKHILILQKMSVPDNLFSLKLAKKIFLFPVKKSDMALFGRCS